MNKVLRILLFIITSIAVIVLIAISIFYIKRSSLVNENYSLLGEEAPILNIDDSQVRDLNKNGKIDPYEDPNESVENRLDDLISQMTIEEKAGTMFVSMIGMNSKGKPMDYPVIPNNPIDILFGFAMPTGSELIAKKLLSSFNILHSYDPSVMAAFNNNIQKLAERTRLGIPITIASDPRHGSDDNPGASLPTPAFSEWPSSLGLAATRDTSLVRKFGDIARQEYTAIGIRLALHPMADLATEPRWGRTNGTFGEDAQLSAVMTKAYVLGFQGDSLNSTSVACMTKHFSGGGPQKDGEDPHFPYGKDQSYPGNNFDYHVIPFVDGAFEAGTAQIMPYYGIPVGQTSEDVAFGFNKEIIQGLLRDSLGFDGVVCTDWAIINDGIFGPGRAWGVEHLSPLERTKKSLDAGCDQFGGEFSPELIVELVSSGKITEERLNQSVRRILRDKFILGLFDDPYVDVDEAEQVIGNDRFRELGKQAQAKSMVLLKNEGLLPLSPDTKVFCIGLEDVRLKNGELVEEIDDADVIVTRVTTPFDPRSEYFLENFFHQGRLFHTEDELNKILGPMSRKPTIVIANLERPAILTEIDKECEVLVAEFGVSNEVLFEVLFGIRKPGGRLPFELPSSWNAVEAQLEDVPYDSQDPLYPFGFGLDYSN